MGIFETAAFILRHPMSRRRPVQSIADWVKWQIGSRILPGAVVVPWIGGTRLVVAPGMAGATGNIYVGLHEFEEMAFALHLLRPGDLMLDVGANVGSYTVLAAGAVGATVHAFEPVAKASAHLSDNLRVNGLEGRVTLHRAAVGAAPGELAMEIDRDSCNRVLQPGEVSAHATTMVPVITLDATLPEQHPALVKIDVEGFEASVLAGAKALLGNTRALISEVSRDAEAVFRAIGDAGLRPVRYEPLARKLTPLAAPACNERGNTLWVRDLAWASERLRSAPRYDVKGQSL